MSATRKYEMLMKMQIGKLQSRYSSNEITKEFYEKKVNEVRSKYKGLIENTQSASTISNTDSTTMNTTKKNKRRRGIDHELEDPSDGNSGWTQKTLDAVEAHRKEKEKETAIATEQEKATLQKKAPDKLNKFEPIEYDTQKLMRNALATLPQ
jgi:hypothetical protein